MFFSGQANDATIDQVEGAMTIGAAGMLLPSDLRVANGSIGTVHPFDRTVTTATGGMIGIVSRCSDRSRPMHFDYLTPQDDENDGSPTDSCRLESEHRLHGATSHAKYAAAADPRQGIASPCR